MINYLSGDATEPMGDGVKVIAHISNDEKGWGRGFVLALSKKWTEPESTYRKAKKLRLGTVQMVQVEPDIYVCNMIAQNGFPSMVKPVAVDYKALRACLSQVSQFCIDNNASVHMPRIGCGIGGGSWTVVESIINDELDKISVNVYDLK